MGTGGYSVGGLEIRRLWVPLMMNLFVRPFQLTVRLRVLLMLNIRVTLTTSHV